MNKLLLLIITALPGLSKLISIYIFQLNTSISELGLFGSDQAIVIGIVLFVSNGWCSLVLSTVPKASDKKNSLEILSKMLVGQAVFLLPAICLIIILYYCGLIYYPVPSAVLLISLSIYQLVRHYSLAIKEYRSQVKYEVIISILLVSSAFFSQSAYDFLLFTSISYIVALSKIYVNRNNVTWSSCNCSEIKSAISYGMSNFLSGGVISLIVPLAKVSSGSHVAGLCALAIQFINLLMYIPRTLSIYFTPDLSANARNYYKLCEKLKIFKNANLLSMVLFTSIWVISSYLDYVYTSIYLEEFWLFISSVMLALALLLSQLSLPTSNFMLAIEKPNEILETNIFFVKVTAFSSCLALFINYYFVNFELQDSEVNFNFVLFLSCIAISQCTKYFEQQRRVTNELFKIRKNIPYG